MARGRYFHHAYSQRRRKKKDSDDTEEKGEWWVIDWQERIELAAQCGLDEQEFWDMTPRYFAARVKAFLENRHGMEEARFVAYHVMKAGGFKIRRLTQIAKFPWDVVVPSVKLEAWDSPAMKKFDEDADRALAILNPAAYAKYMEGKKARSLTPPLSTGEGEAEAPDPDFSLSDELSF